MSEQPKTNNAGGSDNNDSPKLVEVEVGGRKIKVEESGKDLLLTQQDYTKKSQENAELRRQLEEDKKKYAEEVTLAHNLLEQLSASEEATQYIEALLSGDKKKMKEVAAAMGANTPSEMETLKNEIESLKVQISQKEASDGLAQRKQAEYIQSKKWAKEKFGLDLDSYLPKMMELPKTDPNTYNPWFLAAALPDIIAAEKNKAKKEALEELQNKLENTPLTSSGSGADGTKEIADTRQAAMSAMAKLRKRQAEQD